MCSEIFRNCESASVNVRFAPKATELLRCRELTRRANRSHFRNAIAQATASAPPKAKVQKASPHDTEAGVMSSAMPNAMGDTEPAPTPKIDRRPSAPPSCDAGTASVNADESTDESPMIAKP